LIVRKINGIDIGIDENSGDDIFLTDEGISSLNINEEDLCLGPLLHSLSKDEYFALHLTWEITSNCPFNCPFCYIKNRAIIHNTSFMEVKPLLDYLINNGLLYVTLTGGEIFSHPEFIDIYTYLKKQGVIVELYTNNYLLNEDILNLFKEYKPFKIEVTIYALDDINFWKATDSSLDYKVVLSNVLKLKNNGINVICKTFINKLTFQAKEKIKTWCESYDIEYYYSTDVINGYDGSILSDYQIDELDKISFDFGRISNFHNGAYDGKKTLNCSAIKYAINLDIKMNLSICQDMLFNEVNFNINENNDYALIINSFRRFINLHKNNVITNCIKCDAMEICKACLANVNFQSDGYYVDERYCENLLRYYNELKLSSLKL